jgi:Family of unknown function (DUF6069)
MTVTTAPTAPTIAVTGPSRPASLWRAGARAGVLAAASTTVVAAGALAAGVPLEVDGEQIPLAGFAQLTLVCTVVGVLLAKAVARWAARPQRTFTAAAVALTGLSFVPDLVVSASSATKVVLIGTHVVAAVLVVPALAGRLPEGTR